MQAYSSSLLLWSSSPISLGLLGSVTPTHTVTLFFTYWFRGMRPPKRPGGCHFISFQWTGLTAVSLGGSIHHFGSKISRSAEPMFVGTGKRNFATESLWVTVSGATKCPLLGSWAHEQWLWEQQHHILDAISEHTQPCWSGVSQRPPYQASYFRMVGPWEGQWPLCPCARCSTSLAVKWVPWSEAVLCRIPWQWIR